MASILQLEKVSKVYGESIKTQVLYDIDLEIEAGSFVSIIGQSGSGKSTLLNMIGTLDTPSSGQVIVDGKNINKLSKNKVAQLRNEELGFIFQFHYLLPEFSALENVLIPYQISGNKVTKKVKQRAIDLLNEVQLSDRINYNIKNLSGGQQQRVAIARALMNNAKIILADEPTGNLDTVSTKTIYDLMRSINKKYHTTFVIITHDAKIARLADRIIEISDGKITSDIINE